MLELADKDIKSYNCILYVQKLNREMEDIPKDQNTTSRDENYTEVWDEKYPAWD